MVKPEYIHKQIKDRAFKYWAVYNSENQPVEVQLKDISPEDSLAYFQEWYDNMLGGTFSIKIWEKKPISAAGTLLRNVPSCTHNFQVTPTLREKQPLPPLPGETGMGGLGSATFNPWIDKFLEVKDHIAGLNVQLEQNRMKEDYERRIREMEAAHAKAMEEKSNAWEERIMAIASTVAPDLLKSFVSKPINGMEETETNQSNEHNMAQPTDAKARILAAVNKLIEKDPNFTDNIEKLAKLAEKNPAMYQQAAKMINSFI